MSIAEIKRDRDISLHTAFTREEREVLRQAADLENDGDMADFVANAAIKAAKGALATDESYSRILRIGGK